MGEAKRRSAAGPEALLERGRALHRRGAAAQALACYAQALRREPAHADALHLSGLACVDLGKLDLALDYLARAVQANPRHGAAHYQRACILETLGRTEEAAEAFLAAGRTDPGRVLAHVGASRELYKLDRIEDAIAAQQRAAALDPRVLDDGRIGLVRASVAPDPQAQARYSAERCEGGPAAPDQAARMLAAVERELVVIDEAVADPVALRQFALSQQYIHDGANYPGRQTRGGFDSRDLNQRIADAIGRDLKWGWPGHGAFRLSPEQALARSDIHVDHDDGRPAYAAVLYLSLPEHCRGGTSFWRHRATGWERLPASPAADAAVDAFLKNSRRSEGRALGDWSRDDWDLVLAVPMRFNRLIIYRSDYFHAVSRAFGTRPEDSRLVQLFFYEPMRWRSGRDSNPRPPA